MESKSKNSKNRLNWPSSWDKNEQSPSNPIFAFRGAFQSSLRVYLGPVPVPGLGGLRGQLPCQNLKK